MLRHRSGVSRTSHVRFRRTIAAFLILLSISCSNSPVHGAAQAEPDQMKLRREMYEQISLKTGLSWVQIAAIDQYERTMARAHPKTRPLRKDAIAGIYIPGDRWSGVFNPDKNDTNPVSIRFFRGIGLDGSGDGLADGSNDRDLLYTVAVKVVRHGSSVEDFPIGLWEYYHNTRAVQRILQFAKLYDAFGRLDLYDHVFPLPVRISFTFRDTWGRSRSWGGSRIHEGTDIFAGYGVPVRCTGYGVVETKGWNAFGGWRIGIRDLNNLYHYYAHLSGYDKKVKAGDVVRPGQVIGWVGSSGYGRPGTQGKFPPHLHYGVYRDRGLVEWAFDPYPMLKQWEREEKKTRRSRRS